MSLPRINGHKPPSLVSRFRANNTISLQIFQILGLTGKYLDTYIGYLSIFSQNVVPGLAHRGGLPGGDGTNTGGGG